VSPQQSLWALGKPINQNQHKVRVQESWSLSLFCWSIAMQVSRSFALGSRSPLAETSPETSVGGSTKVCGSWALRSTPEQGVEAE